jgi:predicted CXXCH cytochrome family protein
MWRNNGAVTTKALAIAAVAFLCLLGAVASFAAASPSPFSKTSCTECHSALPPPSGISDEQWAADIHAQKGLTCASCHGGDPSPANSENAMSKKAGFRGKPKRSEIPALCARCHSDAAYVRQYNPSLRTDQLAQYQTSVHGKRLAKGDTKVAVCIDCHGVHGIRPAKDTRSTVNPLNVAATCSRCHSDAAYMKDYKIRTDQFAGYSTSVHHEAMVVRGDLSAPTCTTCHGNHGAAPPGVASIENVCASCHVFQAQLFDGSPHKVAFAAMGTAPCLTCHSNHRVVHPTDKLVGTGNEAICTNCHASGDAGFAAAGKIHDDLINLDSALRRSEELLDKAERSGMEVSQAKLEQAQGGDALIKARVAVHSFQPQKVEQETAPGMKVAAKNYAAGIQALSERDYRRKGLGLALITILAVLVGLKMYIRQVESRNGRGGS